MRELDLQGAFAGCGTLAENVQDQPGAVDHLAIPGALKVPLLHGRQLSVDYRDPDITVGDRGALRPRLPLAEQRRWATGAERDDRGMDDHQSDRGGKADRLG
jgi:hypothetical protein